MRAFSWGRKMPLPNILEFIGTNISQREFQEAQEKLLNYLGIEVPTKTELAVKADKTYVDSAIGAISTDGSKQYATLALATADIANISLNKNVFVSEAANGGYWYKATAGATSLTKSPFDPVEQAKNYADTKIAKSGLLLNYNEDSGNLLNSTTTVVTGKAINYDGSVATNVNHEAKTINVMPGDLIFLTNTTNTTDGTSGSIHAFYASNPFLTAQVKITAAPTIVTIAGIKYSQYTVPTGANVLTVNTKFSGTVFGWSIHKNTPSNDYSEGYFTLEEIEGKKLEKVLTTQAKTDLKDGNAEDDYYNPSRVLQDKYVTATNGLASGTAGNDWRSLKLEVNGGDVFYMRLPAARDFPFKAIYSKSALSTSVVGDYVSDVVFESTAQTGIYKLTVPTGQSIKAIFMSIKVDTGGYNFNISNTLSIQKNVFLDIKVGATGKKINSVNGFGLVDEVARKSLLNISATTQTLSRLANKKVFALGDSITAGTEGGYVQYLNEAFGTTVNNYGSSGAKVERVVDIIIAGEGLVKRDSATAATVWPTKDFTDLKCAYIMIGTNHVPLSVAGDISSIPVGNVYSYPVANDYWNLFPSTFIGNLALVIEFLKWKAPECEIHIVAPPYSSGGGGRTRATTETLLQPLQDVAKHYSVHFINGTHESGISFKQMTPGAGSYTYEGIHFNVLGNKVFGNFLAQKILSFG